MKKCEKCEKNVDIGGFFQCGNCGYKVCDDCADSTKKICPKCYHDLELKN